MDVYTHREVRRFWNMMKKVLSIAALWMTLIVLVFVYTDDNE